MSQPPSWVIADEAQPTEISGVELIAGDELALATSDAPVTQAITVTRKAEIAGVRKRLALPIFIEGGKGLAMLLACPDTGSDENIISRELAERLRLRILPLVGKEHKEFSLANGSIVRPLAKTSVRCSLGTGNAADMVTECIMYIFESLVVDAIMGATFLNKTKVFAKHRHRLLEQTVLTTHALRVNSVGTPKQDLVCRIDSFVGCAHADTGSDLDLISTRFAYARGFDVLTHLNKLEFADGSIGYTVGRIKTSFAVGIMEAGKGFVPRGEILDLEFYVLDNLRSDILVGRDTIEELDVYNKHSALFTDSVPQSGQPDCNIIRHRGTCECAVKSAWKSMRN